MTKKPECKDCKKREEKEKEEKKIKLKSGFGDEDNGDGKCVDVSHQVWKQIESNPLAFVSEMKRKYSPFSTLLLQNFIRNLTTDWRAIERLERLLIGHNQIE